MPTNDAPRQVPWRDLTSTLLVLMGFGLIALSLVLPKVATGRSGWTEEKALAYQNASADVHRLSMEAAGRGPEQQTRALHEQLADAQSKYADLRAELDAARGRPDRVAAMLRYSGILLLFAGVAGLFLKHSQNSTAA